MQENDELYLKLSSLVLEECKAALTNIDSDSVFQLVDAILAADKVFFVGVGRVMLSLQAMAKRFTHLGIQAYCVGQINEPAITDKDILIVGSGSGESIVPVEIARKAHKLGARIAYVGTNPGSKVNKIADIFLCIPVRSKVQVNKVIDSRQPLTSLFEQSLLLLGDVIALIIIERKKVNINDLWQFHANLE